MLPSSPAALSLGKLAERGYHFDWPPYAVCPTLTGPDGQDIPLIVKHSVPYVLNREAESLLVSAMADGPNDEELEPPRKLLTESAVPSECDEAPLLEDVREPGGMDVESVTDGIPDKTEEETATPVPTGPRDMASTIQREGLAGEASTSPSIEVETANRITGPAPLPRPDSPTTAATVTPPVASVRRTTNEELMKELMRETPLAIRGWIPAYARVAEEHMLPHQQKSHRLTHYPHDPKCDHCVWANTRRRRHTRNTENSETTRRNSVIVSL